MLGPAINPVSVCRQICLLLLNAKKRFEAPDSNATTCGNEICGGDQLENAIVEFFSVYLFQELGGLRLDFLLRWSFRQTSWRSQQAGLAWPGDNFNPIKNRGVIHRDLETRVVVSVTWCRPILAGVGVVQKMGDTG